MWRRGATPHVNLHARCLSKRARGSPPPPPPLEDGGGAGQSQTKAGTRTRHSKARHSLGWAMTSLQADAVHDNLRGTSCQHIYTLQSTTLGHSVCGGGKRDREVGGRSWGGKSRGRLPVPFQVFSGTHCRHSGACTLPGLGPANRVSQNSSNRHGRSSQCDETATASTEAHAMYGPADDTVDWRARMPWIVPESGTTAHSVVTSISRLARHSHLNSCALVLDRWQQLALNFGRGCTGANDMISSEKQAVANCTGYGPHC